MIRKQTPRKRRSQKTRARIREARVERLSVYRTPRHIYAQIFDASGERVVTSASTVEPEVRKSLKNGGNVDAAKLVGARIAEKAKAAGVERVAFDRAGFKYHGRIKALADAAREKGLQF